METVIDLTGTWSGQYVQDGVGHGITAELVQRGARLRGTMRDADTQWERSVAAEAGLPSGTLAARLYHNFPDARGQGCAASSSYRATPSWKARSTAAR